MVSSNFVRLPNVRTIVASVNETGNERLEVLFKRALFAWLIADGDMHLRNLALLKSAIPGARQFSTVRFAPLYDAVTTRVFPNLAGDLIALNLNGKDDRLAGKEFVALARTIDLPVARAEALIREMTLRLGEAAPDLALPSFHRQKMAGAAEDSVRGILLGRIEPLR